MFEEYVFNHFDSIIHKKYSDFVVCDLQHKD